MCYKREKHMISFIRKNSRFMIFVFALFILGLSIARIFVIKANVQTLIFEQTQQYRVATNTATTAFLIIALAGIFVFALFSLFSDKRKYFIKEAPSFFFTSALTGFMILSSGAYLLVENLFFAEEKKGSVIALCIVMILSSAYFIYNASGKAKEKDNTALALSMLPTVAIIIKLIITFVETTDYQTLSSYPYLISGLSVLLLYFISEGKFYAGRQDARIYVFFGLTSMALITIYALPDLVLRLFWELELNDRAIFSTLGLVISVYIFFRLFSLKKKKSPEKQTDK